MKLKQTETNKKNVYEEGKSNLQSLRYIGT